MSFVTGSIAPIHRGEAAMDGAPGLCGWVGKSNCNGNRRSFDFAQDDSSLLLFANG